MWIPNNNSKQSEINMVERKIFCLKNSKKGRHSVTHVSFAVTSLRSSSFHKLRDMLIDAVSTIPDDSLLWRSKSWISLKNSWFRRHRPCENDDEEGGEFPSFLIDELYENLFTVPLESSYSRLHDDEDDEDSDGGCPHQRRFRRLRHAQFHPRVSALKGHGQFLLWWLFLDKETMKTMDIPEISRDFNLQFITFLTENRMNSLEHAVLSYNWIVKKDYVRAFENLPNLRYLTASGYVDDNFLKIISKNCRLKTFTLLGQPELDFAQPLNLNYKMSVNGVSAFLLSQKSSLVELDFTQFYKSRFVYSHPYDLINLPLNEMTRLNKLTVTSNMLNMMMTAKVDKIPELVVHFQDSWSPSPPERGNLYKLKVISKLFPNLQRLRITNFYVQDDEGRLDEFEKAFREIGRCIVEISCLADSINPYILLRHFPNVEKATIRVTNFSLGPQSYVRLSSNNDKIMNWNYLKMLFIDAPKCSYDFRDIERILLHSPELRKVTLNVDHVLHFDEKTFCAKLEEYKWKKLTHIKISWDGRRSRMTERTILCFLENCPNLQFFENLLYFDISRIGSERIRIEALKRGFDVNYAIKVSDTWVTDDGRQFEAL